MRTFFRPHSADTESRSRPTSLTAAAALVGVQGALLVVLGAVIGVTGFVDESAKLRDAAMIGALYLLGGAGLIAVARGLADRRRWARAPALVWEMIMFMVGATQLTAVPVLAGPLLLVSVLTVVTLFHPDTNAVLED